MANEFRRIRYNGETDLSTIVVTPDGNYVWLGDYGNNEDMIPDGAEPNVPISVTSARINKEAASRGARYFNNAMERGAVPFRHIAEGLGFAAAPVLMGLASGSVGLYNTFSGNDGLLDGTRRAWSNPVLSGWDKVKASAPLAFKTALNVAMVSPAVSRAGNMFLE
mgnify:CR=1 FL=1